MRKRISYTMEQDAPGWPGNPGLEIRPFTSIAAGDSCNQYTFTLFNHYGSHMDGARHFNDQGRRLPEEDFDSFFYEAPLLIDLPKKENEIIRKEELEPFAAQIAKADLLMIRTGFSVQRKNDPAMYSYHGPCIGADAAKYLMDTFRGNLKAISLDFLSLGSVAHPEEGRRAHQYMLGVHHNNEHICIIEDVCFEGLNAGQIRSAAAIPLFMEQLDSGPVTMWVEIDP